MTPGTWAPPSPEQVEANIRLLRHLHGADLVDSIVKVTCSPEQVVLLERFDLLEPPTTRGSKSANISSALAPEAEAALLEATVPGGPLDPAHLGGDVVWVVAIKAVLAVDVAVASKLTRKLYARLVWLAWDNDPGAVHPVTFAVLAYFVAFVEYRRGRPHEARRWAREADSHVDHESPPELSVLTYTRACRLWVGELGRSDKDPAFKSARLCFPGAWPWPKYADQIRTYLDRETPHPLVFPGAGWPPYGNSGPAALPVQKG